VGVLAEDQDFLEHETQEKCRPDDLQQKHRPDDCDQSRVHDRENQCVQANPPQVSLVAYVSGDARQVPEILDPVEHGEQRQAGRPGKVDNDSFDRAQGPWHQRRRRGIQVLPAGVVVMPRMDTLPVPERQERKKARSMSHQPVLPAAGKQRVVSRLVQQHKRMNEEKCQ
jgi:hypothetical protein